MKVWIKLFIGALLGFLLGFLLPENSVQTETVLSYFARFAIGAGRYTALPLIVFSMTIAIYELRQDNMFWQFVLKNIAAILAASVFIIALGMFTAFIFPPERIPIFIEQEKAGEAVSPALYFLEMFPSNMLEVLAGSGTYLFPICVFAFFMAIGLSYDKNYTKPVISIIDSLSRIFYHIALFFSEILGVLLIALSAYWAYQYHAVFGNAVFQPLLRLLIIFAVILSFVILPLFLYIIKKYKMPWKVVYASLGSAIAGFFSGDINFSLPVLIQQSKENLGIRRRTNIVSVMLWSTFGRAGSAMTAAVSLLVIIKSYSSLEINAGEFLSIAGSTLLISLLLGRNPGDGVFAALAVLCARYGHGFDTGYLILKPVAFYLISVGAFIDVMVISIGTFALAHLSGMRTEKEVKHIKYFI